MTYSFDRNGYLHYLILDVKPRLSALSYLRFKVALSYLNLKSRLSAFSYRRCKVTFITNGIGYRCFIYGHLYFSLKCF